ncbi:MAG: endolytic transglycosylase MltG, partial [Candidatus Jorgensenbacteria bacterium]|nr:endolytic transglycosylase MltG [Candidatus Jorgensenbacteria bacterium]
MRFLFSLGACLILLVGVAYFFYGLQPAAADFERGERAVVEVEREEVREGNVVRFTIAKGEGFREIGGKLSREGLIRSLSVFKLYALLAGRAQKFQPGAYKLSPAMSVPNIVKVLTAGSQGDVLVTIPEGVSLKDIDSILTEVGVIRKGALAALRPETFVLEFPSLAALTSLEGLLFPDTYYFTVDATAESVARRMLETFMRKGMPLLEDEEDWYESLILASLLEREVITFADRQVVAGILLKRNRLGMPLQVDATVSYAKCAGNYRECESVQIARSDLTFPSPYNTYARRGFPPTPIASPGANTLKAAAEPV